jgi:23S rRNA (cytidine2498-2'-O)-methyltransferase
MQALNPWILSSVFFVMPTVYHGPQMEQSLYLAPHTHEADLRTELERKNLRILEERGRMFRCEGARADVIWAQVAFLNIQEIPITSINDGAKKIKALGRNWALFTTVHHRRAQLIQDALPHYPVKPIPFLHPRPDNAMGGWTLWEPELILASHNTTSLYPIGEMTFQEDQVNPPSRAYLKLWEFFTCHAPRLPRADERLIDMGACPGGWTWVMQSFGGEVIAVDKAPLEKRIAELPRVSTKQESAFGLDPASLGPIDWFFSDIICYPSKLLELVRRWDAAGVKNFVCTIKYQAETDFETTERFIQEFGGKIVHQHHNKHEVTWFRVEE